jgi:hypothetical protein
VIPIVRPDDFDGAGLTVTSFWGGDIRGRCLSIDGDAVELTWRQVFGLRRELTRWLNDDLKVGRGIRFEGQKR